MSAVPPCSPRRAVWPGIPMTCLADETNMVDPHHRRSSNCHRGAEHIGAVHLRDDDGSVARERRRVFYLHRRQAENGFPAGRASSLRQGFCVDGFGSRNVRKFGRNSGYPRHSRRACREYLLVAIAAAVQPSGWLLPSVTVLWRSAASTIC